MTSRTWVEAADGSPFPVTNLPYGVFSAGKRTRHLGVAIGGHVLDLTSLAERSQARFAVLLAGPTLNPLMAAGAQAWADVRGWITDLLTDEAHRPAVEPDLHPRNQVTLHLPFAVADYVDFYSSRHHAENVGRIFRPDEEPLTPNWRHLPIGYHGRSATVVVSGTPIVRPAGQRPPAPGDPAPTFGPSTKLDIEAELGFVVGIPSRLGEPVPIDKASGHLFGVCLVNDWSARDLQAWEYRPLGPFLGKSFATSISPWIVPLAALHAARVPPPAQDPTPLPYLQAADPWHLDLGLRVTWNGTPVSRPPARTLYWTPAQQLAHLTVNGACVRTGDLYASGTVSGPEPDQVGSFLELTWNGQHPVTLADGSSRTFLEDGDTVTITATAPGPDGTTIGLGEVEGTILPARLPARPA